MNLSLPANMSDLSAWGLILARAPSLAESITYHESMFKIALQYIYTALEVIWVQRPVVPCLWRHHAQLKSNTVQNGGIALILGQHQS